ncbi:MAG: DUF3098 domain-containing protein [Flavobacteriales bacterium]
MKKNKYISTPDKNFVFERQNYLLMLLGLACISLGFLLMAGPDANTTDEGKFDPNYFNEGIFSFRRIRLAPLLIVLGFVVEVWAIWIEPKDLDRSKS